MKAGRRQSGGIVGLEVSECKQTHTLFEYPLGKPFEAKLQNEFLKRIPGTRCQVLD